MRFLKCYLESSKMPRIFYLPGLTSPILSQPMNEPLNSRRRWRGERNETRNILRKGKSSDMEGQNGKYPNSTGPYAIEFDFHWECQQEPFIRLQNVLASWVWIQLTICHQVWANRSARIRILKSKLFFIATT